MIEEVDPPDWYVAGKPGERMQEVTVEIRDPRFTGRGRARRSSSRRSPAAASSPRGRSGIPRAVPALERHARRPPPALVGAGRRHHLPQALQQVQRPHVGPAGPAPRLRARLEPGDAHRARRPHHLRSRPTTRARSSTAPTTSSARRDGGIYFSDPPYGRAEFYGVKREQELAFQGVYRVGQRPEAPDAPRGRLRPAERPLLLARRPAALRQRHRPQAHPRLRREARRRGSPAAGCGRRRRARARARPTA